MKSNTITLPHDHDHIEHEKQLAEQLPSTEKVVSVADAMKQLGDPTRLRIFWILCHTQECVINIAAMMDMSSPAVSHHLTKLKSAGLIVSHRCGKEMYYTAAETEIAQSLHHIIEQLGEITCPGM